VPFTHRPLESLRGSSNSHGHSRPHPTTRSRLDHQGLDQQGLDHQGLDPQGLDHQGLDHQGLDQQGLDHQGLDHQGLDHQGLDHQGLDHQGLDQHVDFYLEQALAPTTRKTYTSAEKRYLSFCITHHISPLPTDEKILCRYVAYLANNRLCHSTIKSYLAAVRQLSIQKNEGDTHISSMDKPELVLREVKKVHVSKQTSSLRQPITVDLLEKIRGVWLTGTPTKYNMMLWPASSLCFLGFFRSGEITVPSDSSFDNSCHLTARDITVDSHHNPTMLRVKLKASKTNPFRVGVDVFVGRLGSPIYPVSAILDYLLTRGPHSGPFFQFKDGRPLTRSRFVEQVNKSRNRWPTSLGPQLS